MVGRVDQGMGLRCLLYRLYSTFPLFIRPSPPGEEHSSALFFFFFFSLSHLSHVQTGPGILFSLKPSRRFPPPKFPVQPRVQLFLFYFLLFKNLSIRRFNIAVAILGFIFPTAFPPSLVSPRDPLLSLPDAWSLGLFPRSTIYLTK